MKFKPGLRRFQLKLLAYGNSYYIDRIAELEAALAKKPRQLQIDMIGDGEVPADAALLIRSILIQRPPSTRIITNARSSLSGGSVLVWLLGDTRIIRDDARLFFRRAMVFDDATEDDGEVWKDDEMKYSDSYSDPDLEEADYTRVLEVINEFLPVKELTGRPISVPMLRQFGLVENEKLDHFLTAAFGKPREAAEASLNESLEKRSRGDTQERRSGRLER